MSQSIAKTADSPPRAHASRVGRGLAGAAARLGRGLRRGPARLRALLGSANARGVAALSLAVAAFQGAYGIQQFHKFQIGGYDLVIFDQGIRNYAHGKLPVSVFKDVHDAAQVNPAFTAPFSILGDHFSPIFAVLAPLYWIWNNPQVLLIAQAALFGLAVPSVWMFARRAMARVAPERFATAGAYLVATAFGVSWPLQEATAVGFHEVGFFVPISAIMIERYQAGKLRQVLWWAAALLLVKEDAGYVVAVLGFILVFTRKVGGERLDRAARRRYLISGCCLMVGGVVIAVAILHLWIPAFGGTPGFYWYYGQLGPNMLGALKTLVTNPVYAYHVATQPGMKVHTLYYLFWPYLFLSLTSPIGLLAAPLLAERVFSDKPEHWEMGQDYNAFLAAILVMAAVDGVVRLVPLLRQIKLRVGSHRWRPTPRLGRWLLLAWATALFGVSVGLIPKFPLQGVFVPSRWENNPFTTAEAAAVAHVPSGVCVEADDNMAPHLSARDQVILLDEIPRGCPWVVLQTLQPSYPMSNVTLVQERADWLAANGYDVVFSQDQVYVYHRP